MTPEEFEYLSSAESRELISSLRAEEPSQLALRGVPAVVCTQVKYLNRCRAKLPRYYNASCIIPSLSFEQCSSEATASSRQLPQEGNTALDLTCGLGVDTLALASHFKRVITIERDELLCKIAKHNFKLLGADNIEVINAASEDFIDTLSRTDIDIIFCDPARRDASKKVFLFEDCSPDIVALMPRLIELSPRIMIKASPMFDCDEALRIFNRWGSVEVSAVSLRGECKELIIDIFTNKDGLELSNIVINGAGEVSIHSFSAERGTKPRSKPNFEPKYIYIPDIAFYKTRTVGVWSEKFSDKTAFFSEQGVIFASEPLPYPSSTGYKIEKMLSYKPKTAKKEFRSLGLERVTLLRKGVRQSGEEIMRALGLKQGSQGIILCTPSPSGLETIYILNNL